MSVQNDSNSNLLAQEWKALASTDKVLFFNKRKHRLEGMAYKNDFQKFFKIIWYYLCGYTRDSDRLFSGIESLLLRTVTHYTPPKDASREQNEWIDTLKKVHEVTMTKMISQFKKKNEKGKSLAAQLLKSEVEKLLKRYEHPVQEEKLREHKDKKAKTEPSPLIRVSNPLISSSILAEPVTVSNSPVHSSPSSEPLPTSPIDIKTLPPSSTEEMPPEIPLAPLQPEELPVMLGNSGTPPLLSKANDPVVKAKQLQMAAEVKAKQIQTAKDDIETEKKLIEYLKLVDLKSQPTYKKYASIKANLDTFLTKSKDLHEELKVSPEKLRLGIKHLEEILANAGKNDRVTILQDGKPVQFDVSIVKETLKEWKKQLSDITATHEEIEKHSLIKSSSAKEVVQHGEEIISCGEIDKRIARYLKEIPKAIEENKGLKFHLSNLFNLENKLLKLEGKPLMKKVTSFKGGLMKTQSEPLKSGSDSFNKGAQAAGLAQAAAMMFAAKSKAKPSLDKLVLSL